MSLLRPNRLGTSRHKLLAFSVMLLLAASALLVVSSFPAAHASGPSNVGTTSNPYGLGFASDDYVCGASGLFWVFYNDGTSWGWQTSTDGQSWSSRTTFSSSVPAPAVGTNDMTFYCSGSTVYYVGGAESPDTHFYYDSGTLNSNGGIAWNAESPVSTQGFLVKYPSITVDSAGHVWVAVQSQNTGTGGVYYNEVYELASGVWTSSLTLSFGYTPIPQLTITFSAFLTRICKVRRSTKACAARPFICTRKIAGKYDLH